MAINKVVLGERTLIDLSLDTATEADVAKGKYFHRADGELVEGTLEDTGGSGGGGGTDEATENDVNFYDYDGTLLYSYPKVGAMSLTELPPLPEQPGLICQGWNWTLEQIQAYGGTANVGAVYITNDGKTRFYVTLEYMEQADVTLYFCVDTSGDTVVINWGDGTGDITYNVKAGDNGEYNRVNPKTFAHTYQAIGDYVITVSSEKKIRLGYSSRTVLYIGTQSVNTVKSPAYQLKADVLKRIEIGSNVADINSGSLRNLYSLKHITIPNGVGYWDPTVSKYGFLNGCESLESFVAPMGVLNQSGESFAGCYSLKCVLFNGAYGTVFESDFKNCYSLSTISITKRPAVIEREGLQGTALETLFIPQISSIGDYGLQNCYRLKEVILNGQVSIGNYAFQNCSGLKRLTGDYGLKSVGKYAFDGCRNLESIELSDTVTSIGDYAFRYCYKIGSFELPDSVTSIGTYAFSECRYLESIELPDNLTSIGNYAFNRCYLLKSVKLPANLTSMGTNVFDSCYNLESIDLPDNLVSMGTSCFYMCTQLKSVKLPANLTSIGNQTFGNCQQLKTLDIPDSVTSIGGSAFNGCLKLVSVNIPDGVPSIGGSCFKGCNALPSIEIPSSVTSIGSSAFEHCSSLASLEIPPSVTSIDTSAFMYCGSLAYIDFSRHTTVPTLSSANVFTSTPNDMEIRVPAALYDAWIAATNWSNSSIKNRIVAV